MRGLASICLMLGLTLAVSSRAADPEPLPTSQEMHKLFNEGKYQPLLQKLARVLQLKGAAAQPYDRIDLLMLRGEVFLQLKQQPKAVESFDAAVKEIAAADPKTPVDPKEAALARATDLLLKQARGYAYTPKTVRVGLPAQPISVLDLAQRKAAFAALLADMTAELTPKAKAAKSAKSLVPAMEIIRGLGDLRAVEFSATAATEKSDALLADLGDHAADLMTDALARMGKKTSSISDAANEAIPVRDLTGNTNRPGQTPEQRYRLKGLAYTDEKDLKEVIDTSEKIAVAAKDFAEAMADATKFQKIGKDADAVDQKAKDTLDADYNKTFTQPLQRGK